MSCRIAISDYPFRVEANGFAIIYTRGPSRYPYLRETSMYLFLRNGIADVAKFERDGDHIVAYEIPLHAIALSRQRHRWCRTWKFNPTDPYFIPGTPDEAVRPCDIVPGLPSIRYQQLWQHVVRERLLSKRRSQS